MELGSEIRSSFLDLRRGSKLPSPLQLKEFIQGNERRPSLLEQEKQTFQFCDYSPKAIAYKNLLGVSISYLIIFSAFLAVVGLQSSLNDTANLGLVSLSVLYGTFLFSGLYTSATLRLFGTKVNLLVSYGAMLMYTLCNYYPHWFTLVTGSVILGLLFGPLWASLNVHIVTVARRYCKSCQESPTYIITLFTGIHTMCYKFAYVPANIASTIILFLGRSSDDDNSNGTMTSLLINNVSSNDEICNNTEASNVGEVSIYTMLSVYVIFDIIAIIMVVLTVDHLGTETKFYSLGKMVNVFFKVPLISTLKMIIHWKMLLIFPMMAFDGFVISFVLGRTARYYISDCIGVYWVGISQMVFGLGSALSAMINGRLVKVIPQYVMVYVTAALNTGLLIFFILWEREPNYYVVFISMLCWGICDGMWNSVPPSLVGALFPKQQEAAFAALRMWLSVGFIFGFSGAIYLSINVQYYIGLVFIIILVINSTILFALTQSKEELFPFCYKKKTPEVVVTQEETSVPVIVSVTTTNIDDIAGNVESSDNNDTVKEQARKESVI